MTPGCMLNVLSDQTWIPPARIWQPALSLLPPPPRTAKRTPTASGHTRTASSGSSGKVRRPSVHKHPATNGRLTDARDVWIVCFRQRRHRSSRRRWWPHRRPTCGARWRGPSRWCSRGLPRPPEQAHQQRPQQQQHQQPPRESRRAPCPHRLRRARTVLLQRPPLGPPPSRPWPRQASLRCAPPSSSRQLSRWPTGATATTATPGTCTSERRCGRETNGERVRTERK